MSNVVRSTEARNGGVRGSAQRVADGLRGGEMKVYFHEHGWRSFYCATAPTASENAERFCEMASVSSMSDIIFYVIYQL